MTIYNGHCRPHTTGVTAHLTGKRWYNHGCVTCEDKLARGLVSVDDPPSDAFKRRECFGRVGMRPARG